jgi:hypothetical protein
MTIHVIVYYQIIHKYLHKTNQMFFKCFGNSYMICWRSILNSKRHHFHMKAPQFITNAVLYISFGAIKIWWYHEYYRNLSLGLAIKARACKGVGQEWSLGVTFHVHGNVGECEGMNPHTPKWTSTLGVGVSMNSRIFRWQFQGSKLILLKIPLHHWKDLET